VLALATLVLLATDPWLSRDYGFALSVLATGGLLLLAGPLSRLLQRVLPLGVAVVVAVPLAAQLACQPVLLVLNPAIPLYGVVANALAEPAAPFATVLGLLACVTLPALPWLGTVLTAVAWVPASWIAAVAGFFAALPAAALPWPEGALGVGLMTAVTVFSLVAALAPVRARTRLLCAGAALVMLVGFGGAVAGVRVVQQWSRPGDWQIAACDIGQGDAVLVRSAGTIALVDTGPDPASLTRCLDQLGIGRIDLLVLSHFDLDHVGGTAAVIGRVDRALVGPSGGAADDRLVADIAAGGAEVERVSRGATGSLGELRYSVLWPRARLGSVEPGNDASVTVAFESVGRCATGCLGALFLGDLGERSQALLLAAGPLPVVDAVKVAHHGSADQSDRLYRRVRATVGLISVGADNDYGHPTDRLLDLLAGVGTRAVRTDVGGLVLLAPGTGRGEVRVWTEKAPP
jgi:competence protein ComEC